MRVEFPLTLTAPRLATVPAAGCVTVVVLPLFVDEALTTVSGVDKVDGVSAAGGLTGDPSGVAVIVPVAV